jgi:hypothetical protein
VIFGQSPKPGERIGVDFAATRTNAAHKSFARGEVRLVLPAGVLRAWTLQDPLQRIVNDPPVFVELRYEPIGGVR